MPHPHHDHAHHHAPRARAAEQTLSLLRLSAGQRAAGVAALLVVLWAAILATIGWI